MTKEKIRAEARKIVKSSKKLNVFNEREIFVMEYRIVQLMTLEKVGKILGVSKERVRQIEENVVKKIESID
jgi:DNA-directed RNA polymerase sigma subunit (sigma70/sigma32)